MSGKDGPKIKKRVLPRPGKRQNLKEALEAINKQYGETLSRLAK